MAGKSIMMYFDKIAMLEMLTDEQRGILTLALLYYGRDGQEPDFKGDHIVNVAFLALKGQIDEDNRKYEETIKRRSEAGKKGMSSRWTKEENTADNTVITDDNKNNNVITNITNDNNVINGITKITDTVTDTVTDTDTISPNGDNNNSPLNSYEFNGLSEKSDPPEEKPPAEAKKREPKITEQIKDMFNSICVSYPKVRNLSEGREKAINARLKKYSIDDFRELFEKAEQSDFLKGSNSRDWSATFDWLICDKNIAKTLDGYYDNKSRSPTQNAKVIPVSKTQADCERIMGWLEERKKQ